METCLKVDVALSGESVASGAPCNITVEIVNISTEEVLVNRRMAVGYRDSLSRELFVDLIDPRTGTQPAMVEVDYERRFSPPDDFVLLLPGEKVATVFNLFDWYAPVSKGKFRFVVHYQADEPLAKAPAGVVKGVYSSAPLQLAIN